MPEKEYIEREAVIELAKSNKAVCSCLADIVDVMQIVNDVPTADIQSVVHAKWITTNVINVYGGKEIKCSACGEKFIVSPEVYENLKYLERFCRHCGAKMDGKE